jgi:hypothetical protein
MKRCAVVCIALLLCTSFAVAQTSNTKEKSFSSTLSGGIHLRAIAGAPFSADVEKEFTKVQPDGSQVPMITHGKMFRDSAGRTRSEMEILSSTSAQPRRVVTIVDPVQHLAMVLDPQAGTATVSPLPAASAVEQPAKINAERVSAKALAIRGAEDMGASSMDGFRVTGTRITRLTEDSENMVMETWFSPELKIELYARTAGPRIGETVTRLQNIVAEEPDGSLFEVPADYTVKNIPPAR